MNSKIDQAVGGVKKTVGDVTGNQKMQAEGMAQKTKGQAGSQMNSAGQQVEHGKEDMKNRLSGNRNDRMDDNNLTTEDWGTH